MIKSITLILKIFLPIRDIGGIEVRFDVEFGKSDRTFLEEMSNDLTTQFTTGKFGTYRDVGHISECVCVCVCVCVCECVLVCPYTRQ